MKVTESGIIIENDYISLTIDNNCCATSLIFKKTGEECLYLNEDISAFSLTQERPFNNEVKLAHMNKVTTYQANRIIRVDGNRLYIGFEEVPYEAVICIENTNTYITFSLEEFIVYPHDDRTLKMDKPAVMSFRLLQLPVKHREKFGEWLNIVSDDSVSISVTATSPYELVDSEKRKNYRILYSNSRCDVKLIGTKAALIVSPSDTYLDVMDQFEEDFDLPRGVKSRRDPRINYSLLRIPFIDPSNVDEYIGYAKKAGLKNMLIYYTAMCEEDFYYYCGDYDYKPCYPNREADVKLVLDKIKAAGITPGLHFLHTHIGMKSRYVTPVPDRRLNLKMHYTLAKPLDAVSDVIYVDESPEFAPKHELCRVLRFGNELIRYESCNATERPYRFEGCVRGYNGTTASEHPEGCIGGVLDISEFGAVSLYLNQHSDMQEEVSKKIADIYNLGFEFTYFDGSEGTNAPFEFHVSNAQHRMYKMFEKPPIFSEGAAKTHFSWHMITGGNAFDMFSYDVFKKMIVRFPFKEAEMMQADHTRVNFGWWALRNDAQPDLFEFGMSRAAAWDCPTTISGKGFDQNPRLDDIWEVIRRWEDARISGWFTAEQKQLLRDPEQEYILLINEKGKYEMLPYDQIECGSDDVIAFCFNRAGKTYVVCWHKTGSGKLQLSIDAPVVYEEEIGKPCADLSVNGSNVVIGVENRRYFSTDASMEAVKEAFKNAVIV